jgi:hypothetical protein
MDNVPAEKDSPKFQQDRIKRLISENDPSSTVEFEHGQSMRFRIMKGSRIKGSVKKDHELSATEVADMSDSRLIRYINDCVKSG